MHTLHSICALMLFLYVYKDQYLVNTIFPSASIDVQSTFVHCQKLSITMKQYSWLVGRAVKVSASHNGGTRAPKSKKSPNTWLNQTTRMVY